MSDAPLIDMFPILGRGGIGSVAYIPWALIAPHEAQAMKNHGQTLKRLAERGGLSAGEATAVIEDRPWRNSTERQAWAALWRLATPASPPPARQE